MVRYGLPRPRIGALSAFTLLGGRHRPPPPDCPPLNLRPHDTLTPSPPPGPWTRRQLPASTIPPASGPMGARQTDRVLLHLAYFTEHRPRKVHPCFKGFTGRRLKTTAPFRPVHCPLSVHPDPQPFSVSPLLPQPPRGSPRECDLKSVSGRTFRMCLLYHIIDTSHLKLG